LNNSPGKTESQLVVSFRQEKEIGFAIDPFFPDFSSIGRNISGQMNLYKAILPYFIIITLLSTDYDNYEPQTHE